MNLTVVIFVYVPEALPVVNECAAVLQNGVFDVLKLHSGLRETPCSGVLRLILTT